MKQLGSVLIALFLALFTACALEEGPELETDSDAAEFRSGTPGWQLWTEVRCCDPDDDEDCTNPTGSAYWGTASCGTKDQVRCAPEVCDPQHYCTAEDGDDECETGWIGASLDTCNGHAKEVDIRKVNGKYIEYYIVGPWQEFDCADDPCCVDPSQSHCSVTDDNAMGESWACDFHFPDGTHPYCWDEAIDPDECCNPETDGSCPTSTCGGISCNPSFPETRCCDDGTTAQDCDLAESDCQSCLAHQKCVTCEAADWKCSDENCKCTGDTSSG